MARQISRVYFYVVADKVQLCYFLKFKMSTVRKLCGIAGDSWAKAHNLGEGAQPGRLVLERSIISLFISL